MVNLSQETAQRQILVHSINAKTPSRYRAHKPAEILMIVSEKMSENTVMSKSWIVLMGFVNQAWVTSQNCSVSFWKQMNIKIS